MNVQKNGESGVFWMAREGRITGRLFLKKLNRINIALVASPR